MNVFLHCFHQKTLKIWYFSFLKPQNSQKLLIKIFFSKTFKKLTKKLEKKNPQDIFEKKFHPKKSETEILPIIHWKTAKENHENLGKLMENAIKNEVVNIVGIYWRRFWGVKLVGRVFCIFSVLKGFKGYFKYLRKVLRF